jgi:hypothetical protein
VVDVVQCKLNGIQNSRMLKVKKRQIYKLLNHVLI